MSDRLSTVMEYVLNEKRNIYISGCGGTGKSYLLKQIYEELNKLKKSVVLTSTTGVSALNIGGRTIHSFSGVILPNYILNDTQTFLKKFCQKIVKQKKYAGRWRKIQIILIDEISMLGASYLELLDTVAKYIRKNDKPFGGIQIIASGDILQLPPVNDEYAFESEVWNELNFKCVVLNKAYRFENQYWTDLLKHARVGTLNFSEVNSLKKCLVSTKPLPDQIKPVTIFSKKADVDSMNISSLKKINCPSKIYYSIDEVDPYVEEEEDEEEPGTFLNGALSTIKSTEGISLDDVKIYKSCNEDQKKVLDSSLNVSQKLELKVGAQVMLLSNLKVDEGLVNGSLGIVKSMGDNDVEVSFFINGKYCLKTIEYYSFVVETEKEVLIRRMIPLTISYSCTIHKTQSITLDYALIDCGKSIFTYSQAYVALSRCKSLDGLYLLDLMINKIYANKKALQFDKEMNQNALQIE